MKNLFGFEKTNSNFLYIEHCSQNDEDKEHIITEVIAKTFKQTEIEAGKSAYYNGLV